MIDLYSSLRGFSFNGVHNHDKGVVMHTKSIQPPPKKKIKESVPFMNGSYDFSTVLTNGEMIYEERQISIELGLPADSKEKLQMLYSETLEWLTDVGKSQLIFDDISDYYFMAEVVDAGSFEQTMEFGKLTVTFVADPFKSSIDYVGADVWDTFNFEEDEAQETEFDVMESGTITIYNPGRSVSPTINCSNSMSITIKGYTANLIAGDNKNWAIILGTGTNVIDINGSGHIKFIFRKEKL
jgi:predicted phage tail component-like protein